MRIGNFNITGTAWSNFKTGSNTNGRIAIINIILLLDVLNVGAGVSVALVAVRGKGEGGARRLHSEVESAGSWAALTSKVHHNIQAGGGSRGRRKSRRLGSSK